MIVLGAIVCAIAIVSLAFAIAPAARELEARSAIAPLAARARATLDRRRSASRAASSALPVLQSVHAALRTGMPLALALRTAIADLDVRARAPFETALRSFDLGSPLDASLHAGANASRDRRVALALHAMALVADQRLAASRSATVIASVADRLAFERRLADEVRARTSGVQAQILLLALLVPAIALYLAVTVPGLAATLTSPLGLRVLVPIAIVFELAGIVASRAILRGLTL